MKSLLRLTLIVATFFLLLLWMLPNGTVAAEPSYRIDATFKRPYQLRTTGLITFTPVATIYFPSVLRGGTGSDPESTDVRITRIEYDPAEGTDAEGEHVDIQNFGEAPVDMTGWTLNDEVDTTYTFPTFTLAAGSTVRVWVTAGTDDETNLYWGRGSAVWNNSGDTAFLRTVTETLVDMCSYEGDDSGLALCDGS